MELFLWRKIVFWIPENPDDFLETSIQKRMPNGAVSNRVLFTANSLEQIAG